MIYLPQHLPAITDLRDAGYMVKEFSLENLSTIKKRNTHADGSLRILFLNLMPQKTVTELDIAQSLCAARKNVILLPVKIKGQSYKTTPMSHMSAFYRDFEDYANGCYEGLIITGAPVEHLPFEGVRYWSQLCKIMDWAKTHVRSTLYICWGAQAGLYHHYGIPKYRLSEKCFGIFPQQVAAMTSPLMRDLTPTFPMPNSRHTEVRMVDIEGQPLTLVARSAESGVGVLASADLRDVFILGHLEYGAETLSTEYHRDLDKGLPIHPPVHYFENDNPSSSVIYSWRHAARCFYANWLNICENAGELFEYPVT